MARHVRRGCGYVTNTSLGVKRPPNSFSLFLTGIAGTLKKYNKRRLTVKTSVFRMDLLRDKFNSLPCDRLAAISIAAAEAKKTSRSRRRSALCGLGVVVDAVAAVGPGASVTIAPVAAALAPAHADEAVIWSDQNNVTKTYRLVGDTLGQGTYGSCCKVQECDTGEQFCAKFSKDFLDARVALHADLTYMQGFNHPNIIHAYGMLVRRLHVEPDALLLPLMDGDLWTYAMDNFAKGPRLRNPLGLEERSASLQVLAGLSHMHRKSVVHLDVKPDNVLVQKSAVAGLICKISDFGNSQHTESAFGLHACPNIPANCVNAIVYRPFTLLEKGSSKVPVLLKYDLWAFGCMVWDLGQEMPRLRDRVVDAPIRLMSGVNEGRCDVARHARWNMRDARLRRVHRSVATLIRDLQPPSSMGRMLGKAIEVDACIRGWPCES